MANPSNATRESFTCRSVNNHRCKDWCGSGVCRDTPPSATRRKKRQRLQVGYQCSLCDKMLPSPEAGEAHLQKKHNGHGFLTWQDYRRSA